MLHNLDAILAPLYFWLFAGAAVICGLGLVFTRHPINGAINLIGAMVALSGIYALMDSPFLAVLQVLVYAGAIMMLVVFVIMVLNQARDHAVPSPGWSSLITLTLPLALGAALVSNAVTQPAADNTQAVRGEVAVVAATMFDTIGHGYWLLFELTGLLLLAAAVAAVLLAKRSLESVESADPVAHDGHDQGGH